jgi:hypothetical protein
MKAIKFFAISAMAAAMITSCSSEDELSQSNYPSDNIIRITAGVNNAKTRAEGAGTPLENPLSLTVVNKNVPKYTYVDQEFSKNSGDWACSETLLWQKSDALVDIVAFAPAQQGKFNGVYANGSIQPITYSVADDQSEKSDNNDLLYYYAKDFNPGESLDKGKLKIQFNHAFCMIDINVTLGTEFNKPSIPESSPITQVTLGGTKIEADVNVTNASNIVTASSTAAAANIITTNGTFTKAANAEANGISRFSCIAIPQTVAAGTFKVSLKTANKLYEWTSTNEVELKSGYRYTLNLTMGDNVVLLKGGSITATPWGNGEGGSLETD